MGVSEQLAFLFRWWNMSKLGKPVAIRKYNFIPAGLATPEDVACVDMEAPTVLQGGPNKNFPSKQELGRYEYAVRFERDDDVDIDYFWRVDVDGNEIGAIGNYCQPFFWDTGGNPDVSADLVMRSIFSLHSAVFGRFKPREISALPGSEGSYTVHCDPGGLFSESTFIVKSSDKPVVQLGVELAGVSDDADVQSMSRSVIYMDAARHLNWVRLIPDLTVELIVAE